MCRPSAVKRATSRPISQRPRKKNTGTGIEPTFPLPSTSNPEPPMLTVAVLEMA